MASGKAFEEAEKKIEQALRKGATVIDLSCDYGAEDSEKLSELPESLGRLTQLQTLYLAGNQLTALPESLGQLTQLQWLGLGSNQLTALPEWLGRLTQLQLLDLSGNQLTALPEWLGRLTQLQALYLAGNQLTALPESLGRLKKLSRLDVSGNRLTSLPDWIGDLVELVELNLGDDTDGGNQLTTLPRSLGRLKLKKLLVLNNPLTDPPPAVVKQGTQAILAYLREMEEAPPAAKWESKLLVVGEAGVGKSELVNALLGEEFGTKDPTEGVEIRPLQVSHPSQDGVTMQLNLWDFGGQVIQHAKQYE